MQGVTCSSLALVYEQAREGSVLVAGNFNVTADICLSQHRKTNKELKKNKKVRKVFFLLTASFDIARKLNYCCLVRLENEGRYVCVASVRYSS
jgi:hypothetical protein